MESNYLTPEDYVIQKFKEHDVIFVGEFHRIRHDLEFIQKLIPLLHQNGIYHLSLEFARREDQPLIDSLLNGTMYDEGLGRRLTFLNLVFWGFQEYVDIYKAAWKLNRGLPKDARKFRILGLNDSPDWSYVKTEEDRDKGTVMRKVWKGGGEHLWAKVILDSVVAKGGKILVYSGIHHAFSEYKQPVVVNGKFIRFDDTRMGNYVFKEIGKRAITICLHAPWPGTEGYGGPFVQPVDGLIDRLMLEIDPKFQRVGFNTKGTPFEKATGKTSVYQHGYENFTLAAFCDGYIFQQPLAAYQGVTPIRDFINEENWEYTRVQSPSPRFRNASIDELNEVIAKDAGMVPKLIQRMEKP